MSSKLLYSADKNFEWILRFLSTLGIYLCLVLLHLSVKLLEFSISIYIASNMSMLHIMFNCKYWNTVCKYLGCIYWSLNNARLLRKLIVIYCTMCDSQNPQIHQQAFNAFIITLRLFVSFVLENEECLQTLL